ncbi:glutathione S-transferase N-terminal domain-containing protein [Variovorax sp. GB1P17]|uniref:glutathione S-transferase N-terminal domain-containing protein n=1 Tax=Variovorax sp. GB1P17 TaxID=3443740 RepID=UPI003F47A020
MKLFYSPGATSFSVRIVLHELQLESGFVRVDLENQTIPSTAQPYGDINPMGKVPALELDDGTVLTEGAAILQYLADLVPGSQLAPAPGTMARYRLMETLNFLATEIHKGYASIFDERVPAAYRAQLMQDTRAIRHMASLLSPGPYLQGQTFTVADAYLYALLRLAVQAGMDFTPFPAIAAFIGRVASRPSVRESAEAEGLGKV